MANPTSGSRSGVGFTTMSLVTWPWHLPCTRAFNMAMKTGKMKTLLRLLLVMPATNAVSERSASALRRVETYL